MKVRPDSPRVAACVEVQRRMFAAGYPCPEPLAGPAPLGDGVATAEAYLPGGEALPSADQAARLSAEAFARFLGSAPRPADVPSLDPAPSWAAWDHGEAGLWPRPEGDEVDLNAVDGPDWIDRTAALARDRLRTGGGEAVIGHCDWLADNVRWRGDELLVVHDWDSVVADSEAVLVGLAAALFSSVSADELATVEDTARFLEAYAASSARPFTPDDVERSWAAGVWTRAYDAKYQSVTGHPVTSLTETEASARLRRAGLQETSNGR